MSKQRDHLNSTKSKNNEEDYLLDGKFLSKSELKNRLIKMDIELDSRDQKKQYYQELYNRLVNQYDRRVKIKSILDTDIIDRPDKNLNRKRDRDDQMTTSQFKEEDDLKHDGKKGKKDRAKMEKKEKEPVEEQDEKFDFELLKNRNLSLNNLMEKIEKDCNEYQRIYKKTEGGPLVNANTNALMSLSKQAVAVDPNNNLSACTFGERSVKISQNLQISKDEDKSAYPKKKLDYNDEEVEDIVMQEKLINETVEAKESGSKSNIVFSATKTFNVTPAIEKEEEVPQAKAFEETPKRNITTFKANLPTNSNNYVIATPTAQIVNNIPIIPNTESIQQINSLTAKTTKQAIQNSEIRRSGKITEIKANILSVKLKSPDQIPQTVNRNEKEESVPGSTKNIKEIISRLEIDSKLRPFEESPKSTLPERGTELFSQLNIRRLHSAVLPSSSKSVVILYRPSSLSVSDFTSPKRPTEITKSKIPFISTISKAYTYKDYSLLALYTIIGAGLVILSYYVIWEHGDKVHQFINELPENVKKVLIGLVVLFISIVIYKRFSSEKFFLKIAEEDYEKITNLIGNNHLTEESPIGVFESNLIRDFAKFHSMTEQKYRKNILPLINKIRKDKGQIEEKEILIQEQAQKVWDFIEKC